MTGRRVTSRRPRASRVAAALVVVTAAACLVAVWAAPRASGAVHDWMSTPAVETRTMAVPGGELDVSQDPPAEPRSGAANAAGPEGAAGSTQAAPGASPVTLDAGMQFTMTGVTCDVPGADGAVSLRIRTSLDGTAWSEWVETPLEVADEEGVEPVAFTDPLWTGPARYVQLTASAAAAGAPAELQGARLVVIDPTENADLAARISGGVRRLAATVAGVSLVPPASAATSVPTIVTRSQWGADESLRKGSPSYATVRMAFIHHTVSGNIYGPGDSAALMRGIYAYHTKSLGWSDIGYNFLVDRYGTIFEGRYGGMTRGVIGAQVYGFNTGSTGISVMGTFTSVAPPAAARTALERLLAWKLGTHGLDPLGTAKLTCGATSKYKSGATVTFPVIAGHIDANYTACPGEKFYPLLPAIRRGVAGRIQAPLVAKLSATETLISPNGDGAFDTTVLGAKLSATADWELTVRDAAGETVASWSGQGASAKVTWDGSGTSGGTVPDGDYTAQLDASSVLGEAFPATMAIAVDTVGPHLSTAAASPASFSPNGDGRDETTRLTYTPAEACSIRIGIKDADGVVRRWLHGWRAKGTGRSAVTWDGTFISGGKATQAADGAYNFTIEHRDAAWNIRRRGVPITLDRTLGFPTATPVTLSPNGDGRMDATSIGFKLRHRATVTVTVRLGDVTVRTLELGSLEKGTRTAVWDGKTTGGEALGSSRPAFTVTAVSSIGTTSVRKGLVVDLYRPRLYATKGKGVALGGTIRLTYKAHDPYSAKVYVRYAVRNARGRVVASARPGWVKTGTSLTIKWKPKARGVYTVTYRATDRGGNRELKPATTRVTVR